MVNGKKKKKTKKRKIRVRASIEGGEYSAAYEGSTR